MDVSDDNGDRTELQGALLKPLENNAVTATHSFLAEKEHWTRHYCSCCCCCPCGTVCLVKDAFCSIVGAIWRRHPSKLSFGDEEVQLDKSGEVAVAHGKYNDTTNKADVVHQHDVWSDLEQGKSCRGGSRYNPIIKNDAGNDIQNLPQGDDALGRSAARETLESGDTRIRDSCSDSKNTESEKDHPNTKGHGFSAEGDLNRNTEEEDRGYLQKQNPDGAVESAPSD